MVTMKTINLRTSSNYLVGSLNTHGNISIIIIGILHLLWLVIKGFLNRVLGSVSNYHLPA